jgi:hypothetical protein
VARQHVGVAISGGGHRATMWGLGTLLYLVDAGKHREVGAVSSVSGGSILNGVVAHEVDLADTDPAEFDTRMSRLVTHVADTGLFFWGPATNGYVLSLFAVLAVGVLTLVAAVVLVAADGLTWLSGLVLAAAVLLLWLAALWFERRSVVVDRALARTHFTTGGRSTPLAAAARSVDQVMCATELQSGEHLYLAPGFVYSYRLGVGQPGATGLSTAVQASACLPGAFAPRRLASAQFGFTAAGPQRRGVVLVDGGVYDNMADQWLVGLPARLARDPAPPVRCRDVDEVVVVNASSAVGWTPMRRLRFVLWSELSTLIRVNSVMYQVTTERRRSALVDEWDDAGREGRGQRGALVHIAQTPYTVADAYRHSTDWPDRAARAQAVLDLLGDDPAGRQRWKERAARSTGVPTVLRKLGRPDTLALLEHSYVLAMCNLHVLLGYPLLSLPSDDRFARLLTPATTS